MIKKRPDIMNQIFYGLRLLLVGLFGLINLIGCGGGGGSGDQIPTDAAPLIQNLSYTPTSAYLNDGNGTITINGNIEFSDPDGNVSSYFLTIYNSNNDVIGSLSGAIPASGITQGILFISLSIGTTVIDNYHFEIHIKDTSNNSSNSLTGYFPVAGPTQVTSNIPDTGATRCYNSSSTINCPTTESEAYFGQDFQYSSNSMSFTNNGDGTITDNVTALMWQLTPATNGYNWYEATGAYDATYNPSSVDACGNLSLAGYGDWRLPEKSELLSIVNFGTSNPAINTSFFPDMGNFDYWTNSSYNSTDAWYLQFNDGALTTASKSIKKYIQCVRGSKLSSGDFVDNHDGTVTDTISGLMWQQAAISTPSNWENKLNLCTNLNLAGYNDWRLPDIKELATTAYAGAALTMPTDAALFSSSTTNVSTTNSMWVMMLSSGNPAYVNGQTIGDCCGGNSKTQLLDYTRCVR